MGDNSAGTSANLHDIMMKIIPGVDGEDLYVSKEEDNPFKYSALKRQL